MTYLLLVVAIVAEVIATSLLKSTEGFSRLWPTLACLAGYAVAFAILAQAISRGMQVGVGYALWSELGTTLIVAIGVLFLGEPISLAKVVGVALVVVGRPRRDPVERRQAIIDAALAGDRASRRCGVVALPSRRGRNVPVKALLNNDRQIGFLRLHLS